MRVREWESYSLTFLLSYSLTLSLSLSYSLTDLLSYSLSLLLSFSLLLTPYSLLLTPYSLLLTPYSLLLTLFSFLLFPFSFLFTPSLLHSFTPSLLHSFSCKPLTDMTSDGALIVSAVGPFSRRLVWKLNCWSCSAYIHRKLGLYARKWPPVGSDVCCWDMMSDLLTYWPNDPVTYWSTNLLRNYALTN